MFLMKNEITQSNVFENDYVMRWNFLKWVTVFYFLRNKFLTVYNFRCLEKGAGVISGFLNLIALFLLKMLFCKNHVTALFA